MRPALLALAVLAAPLPAAADPCTAPVRGYAVGQQFAGTVRHVGDGDGLCVGPTDDPASWVEVRLVNWFAPELNEAGGRQARDQLASLIKGRRAVCTVARGFNGRTYNHDRVMARCGVGGRDVGSLMRGAGVQQGGNGYSR